MKTRRPAAPHPPGVSSFPEGWCPGCSWAWGAVWRRAELVPQGRPSAGKGRDPPEAAAMVCALSSRPSPSACEQRNWRQPFPSLGGVGPWAGPKNGVPRIPRGLAPPAQRLPTLSSEVGGGQWPGSEGHCQPGDSARTHPRHARGAGRRMGWGRLRSGAQTSASSGAGTRASARTPQSPCFVAEGGGPPGDHSPCPAGRDRAVWEHRPLRRLPFFIFYF